MHPNAALTGILFSIVLALVSTEAELSFAGISCDKAGVAALAIVQMKDAEAQAVLENHPVTAGESQPNPLLVKDECALGAKVKESPHSRSIQVLLQRFKKLHDQVSEILGLTSVHDFYPSGLRIQIVETSRGAFNSTGGDKTLLTSVTASYRRISDGVIQIGIFPGQKPLDFDEFVYVHELTHILLGSEKAGSLYPGLAFALALSPDLHEAMADWIPSVLKSALKPSHRLIQCAVLNNRILRRFTYQDPKSRFDFFESKRNEKSCLDELCSQNGRYSELNSICAKNAQSDVQFPQSSGQAFDPSLVNYDPHYTLAPWVQALALMGKQGLQAFLESTRQLSAKKVPLSSFRGCGPERTELQDYPSFQGLFERFVDQLPSDLRKVMANEFRTRKLNQGIIFLEKSGDFRRKNELQAC